MCRAEEFASMSIDLSVVIPAYNEEARIGSSLRRILDYLRRHRIRYEVMLVDDGSADDTAGVAERFASEGGPAPSSGPQSRQGGRRPAGRSGQPGEVGVGVRRRPFDPHRGSRAAAEPCRRRGSGHGEPGSGRVPHHPSAAVLSRAHGQELQPHHPVARPDRLSRHPVRPTSGGGGPGRRRWRRSGVRHSPPWPARQWAWPWARPLTRLTGPASAFFGRLAQRYPHLHRHGYLLAFVGLRPK